MDAKVSILGVCSTCQGKHPVSFNRNLTEVLLDMVNEGDEAAKYVMASHRTGGDTGLWCDGEGTVPEALIQS